ncbi:MAG: 50S ribosomal protein L20 [Candidatus Portnoybacteria bacterium CG_4_8_14_3_um_filter_40_10]|uniref:Large ribosomal subunit protein bL20 n=4 Tax=Candidatus Portnoyibacteriota TaxID=1817913 RepID=A0A2M7IIH6_9BACT|nr:MAG: 50S ribosomal protein L20 [Candidatus Portnoybacteria bacterium CG11_big_fil_rev_8_21_14_0_20_40_15]PIS31959.1 MAG: 50S ribosomal protein L20 [Candidatus Portnoybacteria bacterium CG08_land_8_20_14_0_20_40_83]PIW76330.1 MAG: 50S ribosomal protein L20 [Candidatus Portnoybacteria bacterium CG_4_8_14_3_um_filter_40_10]PIY74746.1 MAG: 50S ribosomal protein L20 [Candidatus Portnoybacteria bacterium CG_4_10_14_0_8_um_filter_40_50]PJA64305.1 MAG: 50S ribosomal protein L20 [Candidatus Portnoyba
MARVKRAVGAHKKRRKILKMASGYMWSRSSRYRQAKDAVRHALSRAYFDRRKKKADFRTLWNIQINAACREQGVTYSRFINALKKKNILLDRKILADLAQNNPETFKKIAEFATK